MFRDCLVAESIRLNIFKFFTIELIYREESCGNSSGVYNTGRKTMNKVSILNAEWQKYKILLTKYQQTVHVSNMYAHRPEY